MSLAYKKLNLSNLAVLLLIQKDLLYDQMCIISTDLKTKTGSRICPSEIKLLEAILEC